MVELSGVVVEAVPGRQDRPVGGLTVVRVHSRQPSPVANPTTRTDTDGRFRLKHPDEDVAVSARDREGTIAGIAVVARGVRDVKLTVTKAASASGRIVDEAGRPLPKSGCDIQLIDGPGGINYTIGMGYVRFGLDGRYRFAGLYPDAAYKVWVTVSDGPRRGERLPVKEFRTSGAGNVEIGDFVVPTDGPIREQSAR